MSSRTQWLWIPVCAGTSKLRGLTDDAFGGTASEIQGHYEKEPETVIQMTESGLRHPILRGIELKTAPGPLYKNPGHAGDIQILMTGANPGHSEPIAWTREINGGRLFYTSLGDPRTFADPEFRQMLANAVFWVSGSDEPLPRN